MAFSVLLFEEKLFLSTGHRLRTFTVGGSTVRTAGKEHFDSGEYHADLGALVFLVVQEG